MSRGAPSTRWRALHFDPLPGQPGIVFMSSGLDSTQTMPLTDRWVTLDNPLGLCFLIYKMEKAVLMDVEGIFQVKMSENFGLSIDGI